MNHTENDKKLFLTRESYFEVAESRNDMFVDRGYEYEGNQIKNSISQYILKDDVKNDIISNWESLIFFLTEQTKMIKKTFNFALSKRFTKFN